VASNTTYVTQHTIQLHSTSKVSQEVNRKCHPRNTMVQLSTPVHWLWGPYSAWGCCRISSPHFVLRVVEGDWIRVVLFLLYA